MLQNFVEIVGLPYSLHSEIHGNFKEIFFKQLIRKFGIFPTTQNLNIPCRIGRNNILEK